MCEWPKSADPGCWFHGIEPIPPGAYLICGECWHCFNTREDLLYEVGRLCREIGVSVPDEDRPIYACPMCGHDF